jgi:DNA-directed RNA polymerase specialized sigma24 family protein
MLFPLIRGTSGGIMSESFAKYKNEIQQLIEIPTLEHISDKELVACCLKNNRPAWEEFFKRYIPLIKQAIKGKLRESGYVNLSDDHDLVWDIHEKIVVKLYGRGLLRQCVNPEGIRAWLMTVAQNQTIEWLVWQGREKRLPQKQEEKLMAYLSDLIKGASGLTLEDTIADESGGEGNLGKYAEGALEELSNIGHDKKMWVLRLSILDHLPLSSEEIIDLSCFSGFPEDEVKSRVTIMMQQIEAKEVERIEASGRSVILWHQIRRMEAQFLERDSCSTDQSDTDSLLRELQKKMKIREQLLKDGRRLCRPANRDIAEMIGLSEDQAEQVSVYLKRARKMLMDRMAKRFLSDAM